MKGFSSILLVFVVFLLSTNSIHASLVVVEPDGTVTLDVLGENTTLEIPQNESLEVTGLVAYDSDSNYEISLVKDNGSIVLNVASESGEKTMDVTNYKDEVIEIEERPEVNRFLISVDGNSFKISQNGLVATTDYEITIDPDKARILLDSPSGKRFLSITPQEATQTLLRAKTLSRFDRSAGISIVEKNGSDLTYKVEGDKVLNFFDFYHYPVEVTAYVSALTGEIISVEQPQWLKVLGFLFV